MKQYTKIIERLVNYGIGNANTQLFFLTAIALFLKRMDIEGNIKEYDEVQYLLEECTDVLHGKEKDILNEIIKYTLDYGEKLNRAMISEIEELVTMEEDELLELLNEIEVDVNMGEYALSDNNSTNELVIELLRQTGGQTLLNAYCGNGGFVEQAYKQNIAKNIIGSTSIKKQYLIAKVKSYFIDNKNIEITEVDNFDDIDCQPVDMIYAAYPLKEYYEIEEVEALWKRLEILDEINVKRKYSANLVCILNLIRYLTENGILISLIPNGCLFNSIDKDIRKFIVEQNYLDTIISLPSGILFPYTGVKSSLIILKKNGRDTSDVFAIDASDFFQKQRRGVTFSKDNIAEIIKCYTHSKDAKKGFFISREELINNDYYLGIERYKSVGIALINPVALDKVSEKIFRGYQIKAAELDEMVVDDNSLTEHRIVNISDIYSEGFVNAELTPIVVDNPKKFEKYCLEDGDIIITAKNTTIKIAVYKQRQNIKAVLTGNLIAIRLKKNRILPYYLKTFLDSESGKNSIKSIQAGTTVISITPNGLKEMKISLLPMDMQQELANNFEEKINTIEYLLNQYAHTVNEIENLYDDSIQFDY